MASPLDLWEITEAVILVGSACDSPEGITGYSPGRSAPAAYLHTP